MSASNEWTDWHLTPRGWVKGSYQVDFSDAKQVDPPADRVLTSRYSEYMSSVYSKMDTRIKTTWTSEDDTEVKRLLDQFGPAPDNL